MWPGSVSRVHQVRAPLPLIPLLPPPVAAVVKTIGLPTLPTQLTVRPLQTPALPGFFYDRHPWRSLTRHEKSNPAIFYEMKKGQAYHATRGLIGWLYFYYLIGRPKHSRHGTREGHPVMYRSQSNHALPGVPDPKTQPNCLSRQASFRLPGQERQAVVGCDT